MWFPKATISQWTSLKLLPWILMTIIHLASLPNVVVTVPMDPKLAANLDKHLMKKVLKGYVSPVCMYLARSIIQS